MRRRTVLSLLPLLLAGALLGCPRAPSQPALATARAATVRVVVGGDSRNDSSHVLPWAFHEANARGAAAFLFLGDMELTPELDDRFLQELALLGDVPFFPVLGNHEVKSFGFVSLGEAHAEKAFRMRFLDTPRTPVHSSIEGKVVYSVNLPGGLHFVALDNVSQKGFGQEQLAWLATDLDHAREDRAVRHVVVGMHKPLAKNGVSKHGMDRDGAKAIADSDAALALFVRHRVSLIVASHVHEFAHLTQGGIDSYITGGLGAPLDRSGDEHAFHHFLELEVSDDAIRVNVVRFDGTPSFGKEDEND